MASASTDVAAHINAVPIAVDELLRAAAAIHRLPADRRDWQARAMCALQLFKHEGTDKAYAVTARLEAMSQLVETGMLPEAFAPCSAGGPRMLAESVFRAAAVEPLLQAGGVCCFDPDRFLDCVLRHADLEVEDRA